MVDLRGTVGTLGRLLVRGIQVSLAILVLFSLWALSEVPSGPNVPEQAGTFTWAFLFSWGTATVLLVIVVGGQLLVRAVRFWRTDDPTPLRRPLGRLSIASFLGLAVAIAIPWHTSGDRVTIFVVSTALAWTVLIYAFWATIRSARERLRDG